MSKGIKDSDLENGPIVANTFSTDTLTHFEPRAHTSHRTHLIVPFSHFLLITAVIEPFIILKPPFHNYEEYANDILFKWHVALAMVTVGLCTESLWVLNSQVSICTNVSIFKVHLLLLAPILVILSACWIVISVNRILTGRKLYASWHGFLGLILSIYFLLHILVGLCLCFERLRSKLVLEVYNLSLILILTGIASTLYFSLFSYWFDMNFTSKGWYFHFFVILIWYSYTIHPLIIPENNALITFICKSMKAIYLYLMKVK